MACEDYEKGAEYARLEARKYQKAASFRDAIEYAKKSITCLEQLPQTEANQKRIIDARTTLANYYLMLNLHSYAKEAVEPILDLALALNYRKRLPAIYTAIGTYYFVVEEDIHKALELIDQAMAIAEEVADYFSWWTALYQSSSFLPFISEFENAHKRLQQCLDFSLLAKNPTGIAYSKGSISLCCQAEGKINPAYEFAQETLKLAIETGDAFIKGMAYSIYGVSCYGKGLFDEAKTHFLEWASSYEKSAPIAWISYAYGHWGSMHIDLREYDDAVNCLEKQIAISESFSFMPSIIRLFQTGLMRARVLRHDQDIEINELFTYYQTNKLLWCEGWMARNIGDILLHIDNDHFVDAGGWFQKAIDADTKNGFRWQLAMDHACYADWFKKKGDIPKVKEQLTKAINIFRECGADGWVTRTEKALAELS
jgi:tetratricopeptide (TPR) repeat protein